MKIARTDIKDIIALETGAIFVAICFYLLNSPKSGVKTAVKFSVLDDIMLNIGMFVILIFPMVFMIVYKFYERSKEAKA